MSRGSKNKRWRDLSTEQRVGVLGLGAFQVALQIAALVDLRR
jgi:flagellar biosynthesis/type III secretory pathway M-ring protein FliF/YscJ